MAKFIARAVVTLALLYAGAAAVFAYFHYEGDRPDVPTILSDFNGWVAGMFATTKNPAPRVPAPPAPPTVEAPRPPPPLAPPAFVPMDAETVTLKRIEEEVLPKVEELGRKLRGMNRGDGVEFERVRTDAMALLSEERAYLNGLLEKDPEHQRANRLWTKLQEMYAALRKL